MQATPSSQNWPAICLPPAVLIPSPAPVTLKAFLSRLGERRLTVTASLTLAEQLTREVGELHGRGRVHGLISPAVVQLFGDGKVRLAPAEGAARPGTAYLAPEVRNGGAPDILADVHAIGAVMYELLTGLTVLQAFVRAPMRELTRTPAPSLFNPGVDGSIDELVISSVERDPMGRPHSVRALQAGIRRCFEELDLQPSPEELREAVLEHFPEAPEAAPSFAIPLQMPVPARPAPKVEPLSSDQPSLCAAQEEQERQETPTRRFDMRRHLAELQEEEEADEVLFSPAPPHPLHKWLPKGKLLGPIAVGAAAAVALLVVVVTWPSAPVVQLDEVPVAVSEVKAKAVFVAPPVPTLPEPAAQTAPAKRASAKRAAAKTARARR